MTTNKRPYTSYTKEFKLEALRLMRESNRPASEIAMELGIRRNQLYKWAEQLKSHEGQAFEGPGRPKKEDQGEVTSLKQENKRLKEEVEILKKAAAYFARELK
ncbi:MAG: transposase [Pseudomonadales bacterium]